ncbi:MAG: GNAT family N-acetyltransferase [Pseudomonadota bacterium]
MKLRKWLSDLWVRSDRFDLQNVNLAPDIGNVRQYSPRDHESCLAIFESNDGDHLREESEEDFRNFLLNDSVLKLVVEKDGQVSGVGGVCISSKETEGAWLSFGMVHADLQNQGVGTKLLLSRLALLPQPDAYWQILMTSLEASVDFYKRFGFEYFGQFPSDDGKSTVDVYYSILTKNAMASVRSWFMHSMHGRDLDSISVPRWP